MHSTTIELNDSQMKFFEENDLTKAEVMRSITNLLILAEEDNMSRGFINDKYKIEVKKLEISEGIIKNKNKT